MFTYTLHGQTYYVSNDKVYVPLDEEHGLEEIDDHPVHLYESDNYRKYLVRLDWGGRVYSSVEIVSLDENGPPKRYVDADEFDSATPVQAVTPDEINECPQCGGWAGKVDEDPSCLSCGYGITTDADPSANTEEPVSVDE